MTEEDVDAMIAGCAELYQKIGPVLDGADGRSVFLLIGILLAEHYRQHPNPGKFKADFAVKAAAEAMMMALHVIDELEQCEPFAAGNEGDERSENL